MSSSHASKGSTFRSFAWIEDYHELAAKFKELMRKFDTMSPAEQGFITKALEALSASKRD